MDSRATHHALREKICLTYRSGNFSAVKMRNKDVLQIANIRDVNLEIETCWLLVLKDVRHGPNLSLNLVLAGKLNDAGYNVNLSGGKKTLSRPASQNT